MRMEEAQEGGKWKVYALDRGDQSSFHCWFGRHFDIKKTYIPFLLTPANLIGDDQLISIGAANC